MSPDRPLQDAIVRLLKRRPFYGQFLLQFRRRQQSGNRAVAITIIDATPTLIIDLQRFSRFAPLEQEALLEHLLKHVLNLHPCRRRERNQRHWDLACDLAINPSIENLPPEAVLPQRFRLLPGLTAEEYYARLLQLPELGNQQGDGSGEQKQPKTAEQSSAERAEPLADRQQATTIDDHQYWQEADRTPVSLSEQVIRQMVRNAAKKCHGELPEDLQILLSN